MAGVCPCADLCSSRNFDVQAQTVRGLEVQEIVFLVPFGAHVVARTNGKYGLLKMEVLAVHSLNASVVWQAVGTVQNVIARFRQHLLWIGRCLGADC